MSRDTEPIRKKLGIALGLIILLPILLPLFVLALLGFALNRICVYALVWCLWLPKGKDALLVYSDSPIWRDYMVQDIIPLLGARAVVLNWSERKKWPRWSIATLVFNSLSGGKEFNPTVVLFRPFRPALFFRFWSAFKDFKHGDPSTVQAIRRELATYL